MREPTMRDMAIAAKWLHSTFGESRVQATEVESLSWLIANVREEQSRLTLDLARDCLAAGIPMGSGEAPSVDQEKKT